MSKVQCPNPKCNATIPLPEDADNRVICPFCATRFQLPDDYHDDYDDYDYSDEPVRGSSRRAKLLFFLAGIVVTAAISVMIFVFIGGKNANNYTMSPEATQQLTEAALAIDIPSPSITIPSITAEKTPTASLEPAITSSKPTETPYEPPETPEPTPTVDQVSPEIAAMIEQAKANAAREEYSLALQVLNAALKKATNELEKQKVNAFIALYNKHLLRQKCLTEAVREMNLKNYLNAYCYFLEAKHHLKGDLTPEQYAMMRDAASKLIAAPFESRSGVQLVPIKAGKFTMGSLSFLKDEAPLREIELSPYWLGIAEVTNAQFKYAVDGKGVRPPLTVDFGSSAWEDNKFKTFTDNHPAIGISWTRAIQFCEWLTEKDINEFKLPPFMKYILPTEAQWEYAAGGAERTIYPWGGMPPNQFAVIGKYGMYGVEPVRQRKSGFFGLFDMAGNAAEWCLDWYAPYVSGPAKDPTGPDAGGEKVVRGGSYLADAIGCRATARYHAPPHFRSSYIGFRVAAVISDWDAYFKATGSAK